jgi:nucleoside-diphosphate-sugar epimerase
MAEDALYLVTGGAGFIGSHLVRELLNRGIAVRVFDNFTSGFRKNLEGLDRRLEVVEGDIRDRDALIGAMSGVTHVLHQAALTSVSRSVENPLTTHDVNSTGTLNVLVAARDARVRRVVYASSSSVYGDTPTLPKREDMPPRPISPYAISKLTGEQYCKVFHSLYGLQTVALRYFNVFGPRQDPGSPYSAVIPLFLKALLSGGSPTVKGDGKQTRDFTYVANVVQANLLAATVPGVTSGVFNVGTGNRVSLLDLIHQLHSLIGVDRPPVFDPPRPGDVRDSLADISQAREHLGYEPGAAFSTGLAETVKFAQTHGFVSGGR